MPSRLARVAASLAIVAAVAGCGGEEGDDLLSEDGLRDCLSEGGLTAAPPTETASPGLGNVSPDFRLATAEGVTVDVVVQGTDEKATRSAADIRGALTGFGAADSEVITDANAIAVFDGAPSDQARGVVEGCLGA